MGILCDKDIIRLVKSHDMLHPFKDVHVGNNVMSYGLNSHGYDLRVGNKYKVFSSIYESMSDDVQPVIDPKNFNSEFLFDAEGDYCIIPPNSYALAESVEYIQMPDNVLALTACKSTYVRAGMVIPATILEAGWRGTLTLELINTTPLPLKVYSNEGILQLIFFAGGRASVSYADRFGKYQDQFGITLPRIKK